MAETIKELDPNLYGSGCTVRFEVVLMQWGYKKIVEFELSGNVDISSADADAVAEHLDFPEEIDLIDDDGNVCTCEIEGESDLEQMIASVRMIDVQPYDWGRSNRTQNGRRA